MTDRETWHDTPEKAIAFYYSLTYEEQIALAFVVNLDRAATQRRAAEAHAELRRLYAELSASPEQQGV